MRKLKPETEIRNLKAELNRVKQEYDFSHRSRLRAEKLLEESGAKIGRVEMERAQWQERFDNLLARVPIPGFVSSSSMPASGLSLTENGVMQPPECATHGSPMHDWRNFRIEYGFECSCPEGIIWAPKHIDPDALERALAKALR